MIITFTNVIGAIRNAISSVITTNLKMWLGFETSETLGREEVVDGGFSNQSNWTTTGGFSVSGNAANCDGTNDSLVFQSISSLNNGDTIKVTFDVENYVSGTVRCGAGAGLQQPFGLAVTGNVIGHTEIITKTSAIVAFGFRSYSFQGSVTNLKVQKLTQITPDKSGNNNVGELFTGKAIELDGVNDEINFGPAQIPIKTISFWIKPLSVSNEGLFYLGLSGFPQFRQISITSGNISATSYLTNFTPYVNNIQTSAVTQDVWQRVVLTFDEWTTTSLQIGKVYSSVYGHFAISDVQFYNETWTTDDIAYDYANPNKLAIDNPSTNLVVTNLKAYWALSEGDGLVAYDSGTNLEEEEVTNGDFATDSDWNKNSNWSISGGVAIADGTTNGDINQGTTLATIGNSYTITYEVVSISQGSFFFKFGGVAGTLRDEIGIYTEVIQAINTNRLYIDSSNNAIGSVDNVSVREITPSDHGGLINGADYVDAQPRIPQLGMMNWSKGSNLFPYSEDFTQWNVSTGGTITPNFALAPNGTQTATKYNIDGNFRVFLYTLNLSTSTEYTFSFYAKNISSTVAAYRVYDATNAANILVTSYLSELSTTDWTRIDVTFNTTSTGTSYNLYLMSGQGSGDILFWGAQLEESSSASAYRLTDGAATSNSIVIANPTIPTQDIFGNAVRDRLNSFNLDGTGYAEVADDTDLDFGTGDFTLECWAKYDFLNQGSGFNVLVSNGSMSTSGSGLSLGSSITKFEVRLNAGTAVTKSFGTDDMTVGNWYHLVVTREGTSLKTYRDTTIKSSSTIASVNIDTSLPVRIGRDTNSNRFYQNLISDVRLYDRALTSDEIENNYNAGLSAHTN